MASTPLDLTAVVWWSAVYGSLGLLVAVAAKVAYSLFVYPYYVSPLRHLPGPKDHHFLLGQHLNQFRSGDPEEPYKTWMQQWPTEPLIRYFEFGHADGVLLNSPTAYRDVMHTQCYAFVRSRPFRRLIGDIIGVGLVFAEGAEHRAQRKALGGLFTATNVKAYLPVFQAKAGRLVQEVERSIPAGAATGLVEVKTLFSKITLDVIGIFVLGRDLHNFDARTEFQTCYEAMFDLSTAGMLLAAINLLVPIRWLPLPANRTFVHASVRLRAILTAMTEERLRDVEARHAVGEGKAEAAGQRDLLTYMIETRYLAAEDRWTKADLVEQVLNFMATGHETTAGALTFATHLLGLHPEVVRKLRAEANASPAFAVQADGSGAAGAPTFADIDGLHYLDNVLKETLRLLPPVAGIPRVAIKDVVVDGQAICKGTTLIPVPAVLHRNPAIWGPDAAEFRPERWDQPAGGAVDAELYAWVGFGHGPRACIGRALATLNFKVVILALVRHFDIESVNKGKIPVVNPSGQLRPDGDVWLRVTKVEGEGGGC